MLNQRAIDAYVSCHMTGEPPRRIAAMRNLLAGRFFERPVGSVPETCGAVPSRPEQGTVHVDFDPLRGFAGEPVIPGLPEAGFDDEMRLVRSWMAVGGRVSGRVFFNG